MSEEIERIKQRNREEVWKSIRLINERLDYIEPRQEPGEEILSLFAFGEIYVHDNGVPQLIPTGAGYTRATAWDTDGQERNCRNNSANNRINMEESGIYKVSCDISAASGKANVNFLAAVFLGGVEQDQIHWRRKFGTANDEGSMGMAGFIVVTDALGAIDVRFRHDDPANVNITVTYANLNCIYIGPN